MANKLKINNDEFDKAKIAYNEQANRMIELKNKVQGAVDDIRDGWQSEAGDEFFKKFDDDWVENINTYVEVIQYMSKNIRQANSKYQEVYDKAEAIKFNN